MFDWSASQRIFCALVLIILAAALVYLVAA
jgi:hypothetical protein